MGFVVGEMVISCLVMWLLSEGGLEGSVGDQTLGQLGWRGDNFPILISLSGIFLPPPGAAAAILSLGGISAWTLSSTPSILGGLWVTFTA